MKVVIFGTGKIYQKRKAELFDYIDIVAFLDNNEEKQGLVIDGAPVLAPTDVEKIDFDYIVIMAAAREEMLRQLLDQKVDIGRIISKETEYKVFRTFNRRYQVLSDYMNYDKNNDAKNDQRDKRLLAISHALTCTGAQIVLLYAIEILRKHNYDVTVIAQEDGELRDRLEGIGVSVVLCNDYRLENNVFGSLVQWADYILINTLWLQYMIDDLVPSGKPILWWLHESGALDSVGCYWMKKALNTQNVHPYSVSSVVVNYIDKNCEINSNIPLLCFGIPEYSKCYSDDTSKAVKFINIGPFAKIKGQDILLKAIDSLDVFYKNRARFDFIGGGEPDEESELILKRNKCISVLGRVDNKIMPQIYSEADVTICSSREESMSVVVMEGFMNGIPGIVSDITGITDYMTDGKDGIIFKSGDVDALREAIMFMIDNNDKRIAMGQEGRNTFEKFFTMESFEKRLLTVFERLDITNEM